MDPINQEGRVIEDWYHLMNEAGLYKLLKYLKENHYTYSFENLKEDDFDDFTDVYFGRDRVGILKEIKNSSILIETHGKEKTKKWFTIVKREGIHESFVF